jgi:hypothetical protein
MSGQLTNALAQAWRKYLISGIDKNRCQNRKVSILTSSRADVDRASPPPDNASPLWLTPPPCVFGNFDPKQLKVLANAFVRTLRCSGCSDCRGNRFEVSYLGPLLTRTLQEDPCARFSDLTRSPIMGAWK